MTIHLQTESVRVRGKKTTICIVAVVCDACGGSHVHADAWNYDTEKALDVAKHSSLWQIEDGQEQRAVCGRCGDAGVKLDDVIARSDGSGPPPDPDATPENELTVRPAGMQGEDAATLLSRACRAMAGRDPATLASVDPEAMVAVLVRRGWREINRKHKLPRGFGAVLSRIFTRDGLTIPRTDGRHERWTPNATVPMFPANEPSNVAEWAYRAAEAHEDTSPQELLAEALAVPLSALRRDAPSPRSTETVAELLLGEAAPLVGRLLFERFLTLRYLESIGRPWPERIAIKVQLDEAHDAVQAQLTGATPAVGRPASPEGGA